MDEQTGEQTVTVRKTYQYRHQPPAEQEGTLAVVVRRCRALYHGGLQERRAAWQQGGVSSTAASQRAHLPAIKDVRPDYHEGHAQVVHEVLTRLDRALPACFRRVTAGATPGSPRCHGAQRHNSFTSKQFGNGATLDGATLDGATLDGATLDGATLDGATLDKGFLVLSKIGRRAVCWSRPSAGTPKPVTVSREADGRYAGCSGAGVPTRPLPDTGQEIGIDLGLESFATLADGSQIANPRSLRLAQRRLKRAQRRVSRRVKGRHRRRKAVQLLARAHQQVRRARHDFPHKGAHSRVRRYATISHEEVPPANMLRNHQLAKRISAGGWRAFLSVLAVKAVCAGKRAVAVPPADTAQTWSGCGVIVQKGRAVRWHSCPACGASVHRDHNAAKNRARAGQALRGAVA